MRHYKLIVEIKADGKKGVVMVDADGTGADYQMTAIAIIENGRNLDA